MAEVPDHGIWMETEPNRVIKWPWRRDHRRAFAAWFWLADAIVCSAAAAVNLADGRLALAVMAAVSVVLAACWWHGARSG